MCIRDSNRIVHGYAGVNMNIVWDTIQIDLPKLLGELQSIQIEN